MIISVIRINMEITEPTESTESTEPTDESRESELPLTGKPEGIVPYLDKVRIRNLYGFDWTAFDIAGNLSEAQKTDLTDGGASTAHKHDHGGQDGLDGDDHTQYHNDTRGDARYYTETEIDDNVVKLSGNQTVNGIKTLGSIPVLPAANPTTDNQAARKGYVDTQGGIKSVAMGVVDTLTPANTDTTDLTIGFTPKVIIFHAASRDGNAKIRISEGAAKGTAAADNNCTWSDTAGTVVADKNSGATSGKCISIMDEGTTLVSGKVTTFASTSVITWEVLTSTDICFSWIALA